jgi:hypothetical protein
MINITYILGDLRNVSAFYNIEPAAPIENLQFEDCLDSAIEPYRSTDTENGYYEIAVKNLDITHCGELLNVASVFSQPDEYMTSIYFKTSDLGYHGDAKNLGGIGLEEEEQLRASSEHFLQTDYRMKLKYSDQDVQGVGSYRYISLHSSINDPTATCKINHVEKVIIDCREMTLDQLIIIDDDNGELIDESIDKTIINFKDLKYSDYGTFYTGGAIEFTLNNWTGVMTYHSTDSEVPPTFVMTDGDYFILGTFGVSAAFYRNDEDDDNDGVGDDLDEAPLDGSHW